MLILQTLSDGNEKHHFYADYSMSVYLLMPCQQTWSVLPSGFHQAKSMLTF